MERVPRRRQTSTFTRSSCSESSQRTIRPVRKQLAEKPELGSSLAPRGGADSPAEARQTTSLSSVNAIAIPSEPVRASARSATSCNTSSKTNGSADHDGGASVASPSSMARRWRICSCKDENANSACSASNLGASASDVPPETSVAAPLILGGTLTSFELGLDGLALIAGVEYRRGEEAAQRRPWY